jgi:hypothetical protein
MVSMVRVVLLHEVEVSHSDTVHTTYMTCDSVIQPHSVYNNKTENVHCDTFIKLLYEIPNF